MFPLQLDSFSYIYTTETIYFTHTINNILLTDSALETIGDRIRYCRRLNKLKQSELSKLLNVNVCTIIRYENNSHSPSYKIKKLLENIFGCSL